MESIFARVFASFWIAIVLFATGVLLLATLNFRGWSDDPRAITIEAASVLHESGRSALVDWLRDKVERGGARNLYILDDRGLDLLGRAWPRERRGPPPLGGPMRPPPRDATDGPGPPLHGPRGPGAGPPESRLVDADGRVFRVRFDPPPRRGLFSPPFSGLARGLLVALALLVSGVVSYLLARSISRPLRSLQLTARALADGDLTSRSGAELIQRRDEIGALACEFDAMASKLSELLQSRQQLLRDLSHELRSPLARLQMAVGLARQAGVDRDRQIERIEQEGERLGRLIAQILSYARLDQRDDLRSNDIDVAALLRQVAHDAEYESQSAPGRIVVQMQAMDEGAATVRGDEQLLHSAIDNVVRNALLHGGPGPIEISLRREQGAVTITVRDHGPGVPEEDLARIFEPFYRVPDAARQARGSGVGLALTFRAVTLHGGTLRAENAADGGLRVEIRLPRDG